MSDGRKTAVGLWLLMLGVLTAGYLTGTITTLAAAACFLIGTEFVL